MSTLETYHLLELTQELAGYEMLRWLGCMKCWWLVSLPSIEVDMRSILEIQHLLELTQELAGYKTLELPRILQGRRSH